MIEAPGKRAIKKLLFRTQFYKLRLLVNEFHVLVYHMLSANPNGFFPQNSLRSFSEQIEYLKRNYDVAFLEDIVKRRSEGKSVRRCAAVTFDDGFGDNYELAYPLLKRYRIPATIFLTTAFIDNQEIPWFIRLRALFMHSPKKSLKTELGGTEISFSLAGRREKLQASEKFMQRLQACSNDERIYVLEKLPSLLESEVPKELHSIMLTWDQIREMSRNGIRFGAHTVSHPVLSRIGRAEMRSEIADSKSAIERETGLDVVSFAYPFGRRKHYPEEAAAVIKDLGFSCAVTTEPGANSSRTPVYELKRSAPWEMAVLEGSADRTMDGDSGV